MNEQCPTLSYAVTVCNEHNELDNLLSILCNKIDHNDEIVILCDKGNTTQEVKDVIAKYLHEFNKVNLTVHEYGLNNDFASYKNYLNSCCKGRYIFQLDADEYPDSNLLYNLHVILEANPTVDVFRIPRINIVSGITQEYIAKWGWRIGTIETFTEEKVLDTESSEYVFLKHNNLIISETEI